MSGQSTERKDDHTDEDDRLRMISQSIRTMAAMAKVGVTYCIVIPGHGVREDARLASNYISEKDRPEMQIVEEICGNISGIPNGFMHSLLAQGVTDDAIEGIVKEIVRKTMERFAEETAGVGKGAGPQ